MSSVPSSPQHRSFDPHIMAMRGKIGAAVQHSLYDSRETTAKARGAFLSRFEHEVDPDGQLDPAERQRRAEYARSAHMQRLAYKSAQVRRQKACTAKVQSPKKVSSERDAVCVHSLCDPASAAEKGGQLTSSFPSAVQDKVNSDTQTTCAKRCSDLQCSDTETIRVSRDSAAHHGRENRMPQPAPLNDFIGLSETARLTGLSESGLKQRAERGAFPAPFRVSGRRAWRRADVMLWLDAQRPTRSTTDVVAKEGNNG